MDVLSSLLQSLRDGFVSIVLYSLFIYLSEVHPLCVQIGHLLLVCRVLVLLSPPALQVLVWLSNQTVLDHHLSLLLVLTTPRRHLILILYVFLISVLHYHLRIVLTHLPLIPSS